MKRIAEEPDIQGKKAASKFPGTTDVAKGKWKAELPRGVKCQLGKNRMML